MYKYRILRDFGNVLKVFPKSQRTFCDKKAKPEYKELLVEKKSSITTIGINRAESRNCVDSATAQEICRAVFEFENDAEAKVAVLYGTGGNFCSGYDLKELCHEKIRPELLLNPEGSMGPTRRPISKPMICAVSGYAVAGGFELALMCDLRVVEDTAVMGVYCRRYGVPLIDGGTVRLAAMVGISRALDLVLTGRSLNAKEAFEWGIANRIVATGTAFGQALQLAGCLTKFPQDCMLADRESVYNATYNATSLRKALDAEVENANSDILRQAEEGAQKFLAGHGRHGKFYDITEKLIPEWEQEEIKIEKQLGKELQKEQKK
ncbi:mevalonyl-coenzyme A hydratase sidH-like [Ctenocephalides felis]|uniref:mevalonyl-coenzyme A hydratase sidH-like n=1 Tax=Ctenocephalides felis TaxID=7515 RepID=UPI000E6E1479|nr:mevalonyl-coenzyme A hydratase sidH-like [Ctenocephalides felis]